MSSHATTRIPAASPAPATPLRPVPAVATIVCFLRGLPAAVKPTTASTTMKSPGKIAMKPNAGHGPRASRAAAFGLLACLFGLPAMPVQAVSTTLDAGWQFRLPPGDSMAGKHPAATAWHPATVPGSVHTDLLASGLIAAPYRGAHEAQLQWIGRADWEYRTRFDVDAATLAQPHSELVFEGLDTFADVSLNGHPILAADNAHRTWRVDVEGLLKARGNVLRVVFHSPIDKLLPRVRAMKHPIAGNYPSPFDDIPDGVMIGNFTRKPAYHYGWDWGPRYVTAGIWRDVRLETWNARRITDLAVRTDRLDAGHADLTVLVTVEQAGKPAPVQVQVDMRSPEDRRVVHLRREVTLERGINHVRLPVSLDAPERWWPNGYGKQNLYAVDVALEGADGHVVGSSETVGLRTVELRRRRSGKGGPGMAFVINGVPVFAKGANVIPFDMFPARVTRARLEHALTSAARSHMNMLRVWGGGYYPDDAFYALADKLGLMIWQDFMFGGGMQPAYDPEFRANVAAEARDNILRLRDHPSLVMWCGNNEEESAWKNWGQGAKLKNAAPAFAARVWDGYVRLFGHDLRRLVGRLGLGVPYWPGSPGNGNLRGNPDALDSGDVHYWGVWAQGKPVQAYLDVTPRFMSEFGLQSWPSLQTVADFADRSQWDIDGKVIRAHQKYLAGDGNKRLLHYIEAEYGTPASFADFVYLSQVMQAEGVALAALHHRASRPYTMGTLYWQLNDVWPGASWSGIDYDGRWKALQFHARRFFAPVAIAALRDRSEHTTRVTLLNDRTRPVPARWRLRVMDLDGRLLAERTHEVILAPLSATRVASLGDARLLDGADPRRTVAVFDLTVDGKRVSRRLVDFVPARDQALKAGQIHAELAAEGDHYVLALSADSLVREVWIDFGRVPARVEDNAIDMLPGERRRLRVDSRAGLATLRRSLQLQSLGDVLHPATEPPPPPRTRNR